MTTTTERQIAQDMLLAEERRLGRFSVPRALKIISRAELAKALGRAGVTSCIVGLHVQSGLDFLQMPRHSSLPENAGVSVVICAAGWIVFVDAQQRRHEDERGAVCIARRGAQRQSSQKLVLQFERQSRCSPQPTSYDMHLLLFDVR
jgi:hypothetical protein